MCGKKFGNFLFPLLWPAYWQTRLHAFSLLQRYNPHARNVRRQYRPRSNSARNVGMDSGLNHVLTVETQLESVNGPVLRAARHPPKTNMEKLVGFTDSLRLRNTFIDKLMYRDAE